MGVMKLALSSQMCQEAQMTVSLTGIGSLCLIQAVTWGLGAQHTFGEGTGGTPTNPLKSRDRRQHGWRKSPEPEEGALQ